MTVLTAFTAAVLQLLFIILDLYVWAVIISAVLSWLTIFNVINPQNRFIAAVADFLFRITDPVLRRVRHFVPPLNGIDLSPLVVIFAVYFLKSFVANLITAGV